MTATWTAPRTWVDDELVSAALLNTHLRDNLEFLHTRQLDVILIRDEKTSGTAPATITFGAWRTRELNTEVLDTGNHATLASNQITLAAGKYLAIGLCPDTNYVNRARIQNVTDAATLLVGVNQSNNGQCVVIGRFTLAASKVIELQQYASASNAGGAALSTGDSEVYASLLLIRLGD